MGDAEALPLPLVLVRGDVSAVSGREELLLEVVRGCACACGCPCRLAAESVFLEVARAPAPEPASSSLSATPPGQTRCRHRRLLEPSPPNFFFRTHSTQVPQSSLRQPAQLILPAPAPAPALHPVPLAFRFLAAVVSGDGCESESAANPSPFLRCCCCCCCALCSSLYSFWRSTSMLRAALALPGQSKSKSQSQSQPHLYRMLVQSSMVPWDMGQD